MIRKNNKERVEEKKHEAAAVWLLLLFVFVVSGCLSSSSSSVFVEAVARGEGKTSGSSRNDASRTNKKSSKLKNDPDARARRETYDRLSKSEKESRHRLAKKALKRELSSTRNAGGRLWYHIEMDFYETPSGEMRLHVHPSSSTSQVGEVLGSGVVLTVPNHFLLIPRERLRLEVQQFVVEGTWSERTVLELFYVKLSSKTASATTSATTSSTMTTSSSSTTTTSTTTTTNDTSSSSSTATTKAEAADGYHSLHTAYGWMKDDVPHCDWEGISCGNRYQSYPATKKNTKTKPRRTDTPLPQAPYSSVTRISLPYYGLRGTLPEELSTISHLRYLDLRGNTLHGTIPESYWESFRGLQHIDIRYNQLSGTISSSFATNCPHLRQVWLARNYFYGPFPFIIPSNPPVYTKNINERQPQHKLNKLEWLDLSYNLFSGTLPDEIYIINDDSTHYNMVGSMINLIGLLLEHNHFAGTLPGSWATQLTRLEVLDVGNNHYLTGTIPEEYGHWTSLRDFNIAGNRIYSREFPVNLLRLTNLEHIILGHNRLRGSLNKTLEYWPKLSHLQHIMFNDNKLTGTLPSEILTGVRGSIRSIDISFNSFTGSIPVELATLKKLERIDAMGNYFTGTLPSEMNRMNPNLELNFTNNFITGSIPSMFCGGGPNSMNFLYRQFGCDAVLCPAGTFHPAGAATLHSGCKLCPYTTSGKQNYKNTSSAIAKVLQSVPAHKILGRSVCENSGVMVVNGDVDGDGLVSAREVLRLLFVETIGRFWGSHYQNWIDMNINECDLVGVTCVNGLVAKLDLVNAAMCTSGDYNVVRSNNKNNQNKASSSSSSTKGGGGASLLPDCRGIPAEIGLLKRMEVISLSRRQFLMGTIPTEIGKLTRLKYIDISDCPNMSGRLPSEMGKLTNLKYLNVANSGFNESVPSELFTLPVLEKLHLSNNHFGGSIPSNVGQLKEIKELFYSNNNINGTIPVSIGNLSKLENLEMYGNELSGRVPSSLSKCGNLKRLDVYNNRLSGTVSKALAEIESLQILHLKMNLLTGTIPSQFGNLPYLSWFDVSHNRLHGTIPASFALSRSIKDFKLGSNMIYDPVPQALCTNANVNGGATSQFGCDGIICPLGTYSDSGHATYAGNGCKKCPPGQTNMYLGSSSCQKFDPSDILSIMFDAMQGGEWPEELRENWKHPQIDICYWSGIICDTNGNLVSLGFPIHWDMFLRDGVAFNDPYYSPPSS